MLTRAIPLSLALLTTGGFICLESEPVEAGEDDFEFHSKVSIDWSIDKEWKLLFGQVNFVDDSYKNLYSSQLEAGIRYAPERSFYHVDLYYRNAKFKRANGYWVSEHRPYVDLCLKGNLDDWRLSNLIRLEYRSFEGQDDYWRLRNKCKLSFPVDILPDVTPYTAFEYFHNLSGNDGHWANRIFCGVDWKLQKNVRADVYYFYMNRDTCEGWHNDHVLGVNLKLSF